ncbi:MAG: hypothetical protein GEU98_23900 [Pseudonocardiaceae bacterium]|nr:hypothetical protein [Pseudonocardiaceae bacterium]
MASVLVLIPLLAAGCLSEQRWDEDVTFKVADVFVAKSGREMALLDVVGQLPGEPLEKFTRQGIYKEEFPSGLSQGDTVTCRILQTADNTLDDSKETEISNCRRS